MNMPSTKKAATAVKKPPRAKTPAVAKGKTTKLGEDLVEGLKSLADALEAGGMAEVEKRFTVRHVEVPASSVTAKDVAKARALIGASQAAFAILLGVSANTVRAWEQGVNPLSGIAQRFIESMIRDPAYWRKQLAGIVTGEVPDKFRRGLKCTPVSVSYNFETRRGTLVMVAGECCDMRGCIELFEEIDSDVKRIDTVSGEKPDTWYVNIGGKWKSHSPESF